MSLHSSWEQSLSAYLQAVVRIKRSSAPCIENKGLHHREHYDDNLCVKNDYNGEKMCKMSLLWVVLSL